MPRVEPYTAFARVYDAVSGRDGLRLSRGRYEALMTRAGLSAGRVLDAACGTGLWAKRLAQRGWRVVGVDRSEAMLSKARRRCRTLDATFNVGDLLDLDVEGPFDLVTCTHDSLNYLGGEVGLERALSGFVRLLRPGGVALFDTNTTVALRDRWGTGSLVRRTRGAVCVWTTRWSQRSRANTLTMELFLPRGGGSDEGLYERHVEVHVEHALDVDPVRRAALSAGFESVAAYDIETLAPASPETAKALFVARVGEAPTGRAGRRGG